MGVEEEFAELNSDEKVMEHFPKTLSRKEVGENESFGGRFILKTKQFNQ